MSSTSPASASSDAADAPAPQPRRGSARLRALLRWGYRFAALAYFALAFAVLGLRYGVLPEVDRYRQDVVDMLSNSLGRRVTIEALAGEWRGLRPQLSIRGLTLHDEAGRPALQLEDVRADLSWLSVLDWNLHLARLEIDRPQLDVRRDESGRIFVAGIAVDTQPGGGGFGDWLLAQPQIVIRDASLRWSDAQRAAPQLELRSVNLMIDNSGRRHRFAVTAVPPAELASRIDLRGDFRGKSLTQIEDWHGSGYAELDYADLAAWRQWVDYPLEVPQGSGALRLWVGIEGTRLESFTADVALAGVQLRLGPELPMLDLEFLGGRVSAQLPKGGFEVGAKRLTLATRGGIRLEPTDFQLRWTGAQAGQPARGDLSADQLDLGALNALVAFIPVDEALRRRLADFSPRGKLLELRAGWDGEGGIPAHFTAKTRFERLGLNAHGRLPGSDGLSGSIEASERGGSLTLASKQAVLSMPTVFADPYLLLEELDAHATWRVAEGSTEVRLESVAFRNADAHGSAYGRYRTRPEGPGEIDLNARLDRADGAAVWRYMPLAVNARVRDWLRGAIVGGRSEDARLRLKGDLQDWPFTAGRGGTFLVTGRIHGATLRHSEDWPAINDIDGELRFEGARMLITARKGRIFDVGIANVSAEIPDLITSQEMLLVNGTANGPIEGFLRFVEASPVGSRIDHSTEDMTATGPASLQLKFAMPLSNIDATRVDGNFRFNNNTVEPDPSMPTLSEVNGNLQFTESSLTAKNITGKFLGSPLSLTAASRGDGVVQIGLQGGANVAALLQHADLRLYEHFSGSTTWSGNMSLRGKRLDLVIESNLQGLACNLPEPFNKTSAEIMPLRIERRLGAGDAGDGSGGRETWRASLGSTVQAVVVRRREGNRSVMERGAIGVGARAELPAAGMALVADLKALDVDTWRQLAMGGGEMASTLPLSAITLKAGELRAFGQSLAEVDLHAEQNEGVWLAQLASREMTGELSWRSQGKGRLRARLKHLALAEVKSAQPAPEAGEAPHELPGLDVVAESFSLRGKDLGRLELQAVNRGPAWRIDRLTLTNPDATFTAEGEWRTAAVGAARPGTSLDFRLEATNAGKLLDRLGYADAVRRGTAKLEGKVAWSGAPTAIDYPSLDGSLSIEAAKGQFNKLEPGVGRLLGILSLQSLPRRITLDFRDIFSEGFAFDSISGSIQARRGLMETKDFRIQGPAAKILMHGSVDLVAETQDLIVRVQPTIGESVAVGTALLNPAIGLATLLAQKILRDPLDQMFAYEYAVSGGWSDPKVEKIAAKPLLPANER